MFIQLQSVVGIFQLLIIQTLVIQTECGDELTQGNVQKIISARAPERPPCPK